jgi:hypothetical protein
MFELVYTYEWYDGPRKGIADYQGKPHLFESEWDTAQDDYSDWMLLTPIGHDTFVLALEDWAIWRRWEKAFYHGNATRDTHPALPEDRRRHEELQRLLEGRLVVDPAQAVRMKAEFRVRSDAEWSGYGCRSLEVQWEAEDSQSAAVV